MKFDKTFVVVLRAAKSFALVALLTLPVQIAAQYQGNPVKPELLEKYLRTKQVSTAQAVQAIKKRGVDFELTPDLERRLTAAGARPEIFDAIRQNYRQELAAKPAATNPPASNSPVQTPIGNQTPTNFNGAPLTKDAVIALLQNGVPDAQVQKNIGARGVSFQMNPDIAKELKAAGGSDALVGTIFGAFKGSLEPELKPEPKIDPAKTAADAYDDLINQANDSYNSSTAADSSQVNQSLQFLRKAAQLDPNNPIAFQGLGFQSLYGLTAGNFGEVEGYFNKAINLGGNAVVRVYHDHNGTFYDVCEGTLYISKDAVRFESDNNVHTFETAKDNVQQVKLNNAFKQMYQEKKGSYKIVLKSEDAKGVKFSFAPLTQNLEESKMVVRLVGKS